MGVSVVSRLKQQELKPSAVSGLETTATSMLCGILGTSRSALCASVNRCNYHKGGFTQTSFVFIHVPVKNFANYSRRVGSLQTQQAEHVVSE